jgi:hypothetical protein
VAIIELLEHAYLKKLKMKAKNPKDPNGMSDKEV